MGLDGVLRGRGKAVVGILNGVDYEEWSPEADKLIPQRYTATDLTGKEHCKQALLKRAGLPSLPNVPLIGIVSRLAGQKGFDLFPQALPRLLARERFQLIVTGSGERHFERMFRQLAATFPQQVRFNNAFDNEMAHWIEAGSDFFLMPSRYEPCGLNQMYSLRYGTVPVVRATGGLYDTVRNFDRASGTGTGFTFEDYSSRALLDTLRWALSLYENKRVWRRIQAAGMRQDFSWDHSARQYVSVYERANGRDNGIRQDQNLHRQQL